MKLWILSDLHADRGIEDMAINAPDFDVFVCAGDMLSGGVAEVSIYLGAREERWKGPHMLANEGRRGEPAVLIGDKRNWKRVAL